MYIYIYVNIYHGMRICGNAEIATEVRGRTTALMAPMCTQKKNSKIGSWKDDRAHGAGLYTYASGEEFNGEWVKGKKSGKGSFRFLNGDLYTGEFRDDDINGKP